MSLKSLVSSKMKFRMSQVSPMIRMSAKKWSADMKYRKIVVAVVAVLLSLTGCSGQVSNNAAVVGDKAISVRTVDTIFNAYLNDESLLPDRQEMKASQKALLKSKLLQMLVLGEAAKTIMEKHKIPFDSAIQDQVLARDQNMAKMAQNPAFKPLIENFTAIVIVQNSISQAEFVSGIEALDIKINPLYGQWTLKDEPKYENIVSALALPDNGKLQGIMSTVDSAKAVAENNQNQQDQEPK